ncbi:MAG: hypothetical protein OT477_08920 [Chloroflexi bacterium]|nr:hypothetical protein [Chloroflexota bacterium]
MSRRLLAQGGGRAITPNYNNGLMGFWLLSRVGFAPSLGERAARQGFAFFACLSRRPPAPTSLPCSPAPPLLGLPCRRAVDGLLTAPPDLLVYESNWNGLETIQSIRVNCCVFRWGFILVAAGRGGGERRRGVFHSRLAPPSRPYISPLLPCPPAPPPPPPPHHTFVRPITTAASPTAVSNTAVAPCGSPALRCVASVSA